MMPFVTWWSPKINLMTFALFSLGVAARHREQMTLIEWRLFAAIRPNELLGQAWNRPGAKSKCPNVLNMIERSNQVPHASPALGRRP
jgi:hypothetical protein